MVNLPVEFLEWDSDFFGKRIARVTTGCLLEDELKRVFDWSKEQHIDCLYYLASGLDTNSTRAAEVHGFHFMDLRVKFSKDLRKPEKDFIPLWHIRRAVEDDIEMLKKMAREAFPFSRFKVDPHFDPALADRMYEVWIEKDLHLAGHDVWVIDVENELAAFTSVSSKLENKAQIGLVGTRETWRGKGLSLELQHFVCTQLRKEDILEVEVVTQARNISAQKLYQRAGYFINSIDLWYHKWF